MEMDQQSVGKSQIKQLANKNRALRNRAWGNEIRRRGEWGEAMALSYLRKQGWECCGQRVRPCKSDRRCEIDLIVQSKDGRSIVFVEVKTHKGHSSRASRLWSIDKRKKGILLRACTNWILRKKWHGNFRFDVIEVYGTPGGPPPEIDHIPNVPLFPAKWRFW